MSIFSKKLLCSNFAAHLPGMEKKHTAACLLERARCRNLRTAKSPNLPFLEQALLKSRGETG